MTASQSFPTVSAAGFRAYIDLIAYESTTWAALIHALSLFGHKTAVDAIRARLRMGESATLTLPEAMMGRLVLPDTVVSRTRRAGEIAHATLLRAPARLGDDTALRYGESYARYPAPPEHSRSCAGNYRRIRALTATRQAVCQLMSLSYGDPPLVFGEPRERRVSLFWLRRRWR